ncbi:glycosyltransferase family 2 protein [Blastococcus sp. SYSU D00669]
MTSVLLVCPSITAEHAERFCEAAAAAVEKGADLRAVLVANSASTHALAERWPELVVRGENAGFAVSINQGVRAGGPFRWLVVVNDDQDFDAATFVTLAEHLAGEPAEGHRMIRLTQEMPWRHIPGVAGVFTSLSLLEKVAYGLGRQLSTDPEPASPDLYPPLSLVAIGADLWEDVGGLEESLPFCFEDAWFARQARASAGGVRMTTFDLGVHHFIAATTGSRIDVVLPVIAWSSVVYLQLLGVPAAAARALCVLALVIRAPLCLGGSADPRKHLRGIARSIRAIVTGREPRLPRPDAG